MSSGKKPKKVKAPQVTSAYNGVTTANYGSDFGGATSTKDGNALNTTTTLSSGLQPASQAAQSGLGASLGYLNRSPADQYAYATSGQDPYYNVLSINADRALANSTGQAALAARRLGGTNSTAYGSALGTVASNDALQRNQNLLAALQYGNQTARDNAATQLGTIGGLAQLTYPLATAANNNLLTAFNQQDATAEANAARQMEANKINTAALNAYNQQQSAMWGNAIGTVLGPVLGQPWKQSAAAQNQAAANAYGGYGGNYGGGYGGGYGSLGMTQNAYGAMDMLGALGGAAGLGAGAAAGGSAAAAAPMMMVV